MSAPRIKKFGLAGFNKPKRTPSHPKKSHVVLAKEGARVKLIRLVCKAQKINHQDKASQMQTKQSEDLSKQDTQEILQKVK